MKSTMSGREYLSRPAYGTEASAGFSDVPLAAHLNAGEAKEDEPQTPSIHHSLDKLWGIGALGISVLCADTRKGVGPPAHLLTKN